MKSWHLAAAMLLLGTTARAEVPASQRSRPYRDFTYVTAQPRNAEEVMKLWSLSEHVLSPHDPALKPHKLVLSPKAQRRLEASGIPFTVEPLNVQEMIDRSYTSPLTGQSGKLGIFGPFFESSQPLDKIDSYLDELEKASNGKAKIIVIGKTFEGRDIRVMRISSNPDAEHRASTVVVGTHHAREWISPMVVMGLIDGLIRQYGKDDMVTKVVDNVDTYIIPVLNRDGYLSSFSGNRLQRKNMHKDCNVDLNRNYDVYWGHNVDQSCDGETYPGAMAFSEPESQAVRDLAKTLKQLRLAFDFHSAAVQVMIPFAHTEDKPPNYDQNKEWAELYSSTEKTVNGNDLPAEPGYNLGMGQGGGANDWFCAEKVVSLVAELRGSGEDGGFGIPTDGVIPSVEENWKAWLTVAAKMAEANPSSGGGGGNMDASAPTTMVDMATASVDAAVAGGSGGHGGGGGGGSGGSGGAGGGGKQPSPSGGQNLKSGGCAVEGSRGSALPSLLLLGVVALTVAKRRRFG